MIIRPYKESDFDEVISAHKICFATFDFDYEVYLDEYRKFFNPDRTIIAELDEVITGFACYSLFGDEYQIEPDQLESVDDCINLEGQLKQDYLKRLSEKQQELGKGKVIVERFLNWFTENNYQIQPGDGECTSLAVLPQYRKQGFGNNLANKMLDLAKEHGGSAVFVRCWEGGVSSIMSLSHGYHPIARIGPMYPDGESALIMGKKI